MQFKLTNFEIKKLGEDSWQKIPEKMFLEKLLAFFDPITPTLNKMLQGGETTTPRELYRLSI